ncbi:MAG: DedA family protein [Thermoplasmata archaeon]
MNIILKIIDIILNLGDYLDRIIAKFGILTYFLLFLVIFCETGLVIFPFLPGDSLRFAAGAIAARGSLNLFALWFIFTLAAITGDTVNYWIGRKVGKGIFEKEKIRFVKKKHLLKTRDFYEKHGGKTIVIARFIPIIRTFAPFVAGIGAMKYRRFLAYNVLGGVLWVTLFLILGYWFGNISLVKENFSFVIIAIILISFAPIAVEYVKEKKMKKEDKK